jgi:replicative DNA helicase
MDHFIPYSLEAEQSIIGCLLLDESLIKDCALTPQHFYIRKFKILFQAMKELDEKNKPIDVVSIVEQLGIHQIENLGGIIYLTQLAGSIPTTANFHYYEQTVKDHFQKRKTIETAQNLIHKAQGDDISQTIHEGIQELMTIEDDYGEDDSGDIHSGLIEIYDDCQKDLGDLTGIPSGFKKLDELTGGFQESDFIVIGARPSVGKTAFALNLALQAYDEEVSAIFSMEMPKKQLLKRATGILGSISSMKMRNPRRKFQQEDWGSLTDAIGQISKRNLHIFDRGGMDINYIWSKVRKLKRHYGEGKRMLVIIDYLQLITGDPQLQGNRVAEISEISRMLKRMAREVNVTVIALSQLSRGVESRQEKRPMLSDLRESGQIEQDSDLIAFLYRDDYYNRNSEENNLIEVILAKHRNGPIGTVKLEFLKEVGLFLDVEG